MDKSKIKVMLKRLTIIVSALAICIFAKSINTQAASVSLVSISGLDTPVVGKALKMGEIR